MKIRVVALYLPQYHPFKENDEWWGKGFTEWTNVTKAKPRFHGHYQPHLPSDLGFYDLRIPEVREEQAKMAKENGIYGFCYYHYWFNGHQLMERPMNEILKSGKPDFPFMLCWANENWTRVWDGGERNVLIEQKYSEKDDREHIQYLIEHYFKDPRYIRVNGKPVFGIYRSDLFPDIKTTLKIWREEAARHHIELYLCFFESFANSGITGIRKGFDATIEFQPHSMKQNGFLKNRLLGTRIVNKLSRIILRKDCLPTIISYKKYVQYMCTLPMPSYKRYPCVTPMWDNAARRKNNFMAFVGNTPQLYAKWLKYAIQNFKPFSEEENFVFINAWNEWAEGNHLEPCQKWGKEYLEKTKEVLEDNY